MFLILWLFYVTLVYSGYSDVCCIGVYNSPPWQMFLVLLVLFLSEYSHDCEMKNSTHSESEY